MIDIKNLKLSFGEKIIFKNLSLRISDNSRIGIVGANGAGKTTLLKILIGDIQPDDGFIEAREQVQARLNPVVNIRPLNFSSVQ